MFADNTNSRSANGTLPPGFERRQAELDQQIVSGRRCPECNGHDTECNGSTEYRCRDCDHRWGLDGGPRGERYGY
jgi:ribosomal protein L37AE/L43A